MCKHIAETISTPLEDVHEWMNDVYDIEWITFQDGSFKGARLLVAGGGPTIWVNVYCVYTKAGIFNAKSGVVFL